jgi:hypothetical protein
MLLNSDTKTRVIITKKHRGRMTVTLKFNLTKEDAAAFQNWKTSVCPENVTEENFVKTVFFMGVETLNNQIRNIAEQEKAKIQQQSENNQQES